MFINKNHPGARWSLPIHTQALVEKLVGKIPGPIWEPACGSGVMATTLADAEFDVVGSDICWYEGWEDLRLWDFRAKQSPPWEFNSIVFNPPWFQHDFFGLRDWMQMACWHQPKLIAMLAPLAQVGQFLAPRHRPGYRITRGILFSRALSRYIVPDEGRRDGAAWEVCWTVLEPGNGGPEWIEYVE